MSEPGRGLQRGLQQIRWLLAHEVRGEDPECCLFAIEEIVAACLGTIPGVPPDDLEEEV